VARPEDRELLEQSLAQHKEELRIAVQELRLAARSWSDPIRQRPIIWLATAFLLGLWLGRDRRING
jgi:hypothetical protein